MEKRILYVGKWYVCFLFANKRYDIDCVLDTLVEYGAPDSVLERAYELMVSEKDNTGFTFTDQEEHLAVVVIGPVSSGDEFIDTLVHEIHHLAVAVASSLGIDLEKETPAYISGDAARELADLVCALGCSRCNS